MKKKNTLIIVAALYFFSFQIFNAYINLMLIDINAEYFTSTFWMINSWTIIIGLPISGYVIDKFRDKSLPIGFGLLFAAFIPIILRLPNLEVALVIFAVYYGLFVSILYWFIEAFLEQASMKNEIKYERVRAAGSLSYGAASLITGSLLIGSFLFFKFDPFTYSQLYLLITPLLLVASLLVFANRGSEFNLIEKLKFSKIQQIFKNKHYVLIFIFIVIVYGLYSFVFKKFAPQQVQTIIADPATFDQFYAIKNALAVLVEAGVFFIFAKRVNQDNCVKYLTIGAAAMIFRTAGLMLHFDPWLLMISECSHALGFGLTLLGLFKYLEKYVDGEYHYTAYAIGMPIAGAIVIGFLSPFVDAAISASMLSVEQFFFGVICAIITATLAFNLIYKKL